MRRSPRAGARRFIDYNGDGKIGAYTKPNEPPDPKLDRAVGGAPGYGIAVNPVDGSVWNAAGVDSATAEVPGQDNPHGDRREPAGNMHDGSLRAAV